ncbi:metabotropic glutamate receptor 5-like isoform X2 [Planococcus citri]|uniref:metabotropic glutamate receptor 5-like isoform X2 n=1 Tax=Planococcus citri TaxID=170843 RepID=UPI0031F8FDC6
MKLVIIVVSILFSSSCEFDFEYSHIHEAQRKSALIGGDLMIGALFPIHQAPSQTKQKIPLTCGAIREQYGIQRVEAALRTVEQINKSPDILPNITLGIEIRDTCWNPLIALHQSLKFVQKLFVTNDWVSCRSNSPKICEKDAPPILGVIGPASSEEAIQVQNLLQLFHIPQVGYSTTSSALSDKKKFQYFVRVVPSDNFQALVMVEILQKYNWTYVFAVNSEGEYGRSGITRFKTLALENDICIASEHTIYDKTRNVELDEVVRKFAYNGKSRVIVCFCEGYDVRRLLEATKRTNMQNNFVFIGSDSWAGRDDVIKGVEEAAQGNIMISLHSPHVSDFDNYYANISKRNDSIDPWLDEFRNYKFNCTMNKTSKHFPPCTGKELIGKDYVQDPKLSFVVKSIYALARALHGYRNDICGKNAPVCTELYPINGTLFMEYLRNVTFDYEKEIVKFDENGDPPARYDIMNFQDLGNDSYGYVKVGHWINDKMQLNMEQIQFPEKAKTVRSVCSEPCKPGFKKILPLNGNDNKTCCWNCIPCKSKEISDGEICIPCEIGYRPNAQKTECIEMPHDYVHFTDLMGIIGLAFSIIGIALTTMTMMVFYKYGNTPVVKSSTKELCYIMFFGMILAHSCSFVLIGEPTIPRCTIVRIVPGISLCIMYSALLVKTNRISRILSMSKKRFPTLKPRLMSTMSQVYLCAFLVSLEFLICMVSIYLLPVDVEKNEWKVKKEHGNISYDKVVLGCSNSDLSQELMLQFFFNVVLLLFCILYAVKTRKLPDNFNEAKCIGFACYATAITWLAFIAIYFGSQLQVLSQCISLSTSALIVLIFLFFPKLYIILCKPEKNIRANFKTTKNLRCHFGSVYLLQNCEQLMSGMIKNGFLPDVSNIKDIDQLHKTLQECYSNQSLMSNYNREIISKSCQTSMDKLYFQISNVAPDDDTSATTSDPENT